MSKRDLQRGDVVQIAPNAENAFGGCFMLVTEPKSWGAQGFVAVPERRGVPPAEAYVRAEWEQMEYVGRAAWEPRDDAGEVQRTEADDG